MSRIQQPVHIAHLIWHFGTGGLENGVVNLINNLPEQEYIHSIITLTGHQHEFAQRIQTANVSFYCLNKSEGHDWSILPRLHRLLKHLQPDVLHSRNIATLELQIIGWWQNIPLRLHGEHGWDSYDIAGNNKKYRILRRLLKPFVHRFICLSAESEHYLKNYVAVKAKNIVRICNGVDIAKFSQSEPVDLTSFGITPAMVLIGTVGRLAKVKNQALLIDAFALICQRHPELIQQCKLVIIGDGPCRTELEHLAQSYQLDSKIIFAGNRSDVAQLMQNLDIFVLPSLAEGISNTILEAMASGLPVIATSVGGNSELLPPNLHASNLIPSNDAPALAFALIRYLQSSEARLTDGALLKKHCQQHFSIARMVERYRTLYDTTRKHN